MDIKKMTPAELYELAKKKYYKVYDFDKGTKVADKRWIRVGLIPDPNKKITWNFFDGERLVSPTNFDKAEPFCDGTSVVVNGGKYNVLKDDGALVFSDWYDYVAKCDDCKHYIIEANKDKYGLVKTEAFSDLDGKVVSEWYDQMLPMLHRNLWCVSKGKSIAERKNAVFDLDKCETVTDWYDSVMMFQWKDMFGKPFARVKKDGLNNLMDGDLDVLFSVWSKRPIEVGKDGSCQIFSSDGTVYNANVNTRKLEIVS